MLSQGIPTIDSYKKLLTSRSFLNLENFSNTFIKQNDGHLSSYIRKWVKDPLHNWSRQWEYPFVFEKITTFREHRNASSISILDAGSGITFFPYYIASQLKKTKVTCLDSNSSLQNIYSNINRHSKNKVDFDSADIRNLPYKNHSFDVIYCISVLEHTNNFEEIIKEFKRVLKKGGIFIITFDISLNGDADIPINTARKLLKQVGSYFPKRKINLLEFTKQITSSKIVTTRSIRKFDKNLLPWKYPILSYAKSLLKLKRQKGLIKNLTFYCIYYET